MQTSKNSLVILNSKLNSYICYISYKENGFIYEVPYTKNNNILKKIGVSDYDFNQDVSLKNKITVVNLISEKIEHLDSLSIINFRFKLNVDKSINDVKNFKINLKKFKDEHLENITSEFLQKIICIQRSSIFSDTETIYKKPLFLSKNLYFTKFIDFLNITSINQIKKLLSDDDEMLNVLKSKWIERIDKSKQDVLLYIDQQMTGNKDDDALIKSLNEIKETVLKYDYVTEINSLQSVTEILETWPSLFLPAPDFVNKLNKNYIYDKL